MTTVVPGPPDFYLLVCLNVEGFGSEMYFLLPWNAVCIKVDILHVGVFQNEQGLRGYCSTRNESRAPGVHFIRDQTLNKSDRISHTIIILLSPFAVGIFRERNSAYVRKRKHTFPPRDFPLHPLLT